MTGGQSAIAILERIRELETELAGCLRELGSLGEDVPERHVRAVEVGVGPATYLLPVDSIEEVVPMMWPQLLPDAPDWVMGTFQYGAETVPLVDMAMRLEGEPSVLGTELLVVVGGRTRSLGLVVSRVAEVREVDSSQLATPGPTFRCAPFVLGTLSGDDGDAIHLLSIERLGRELHG